MRKNKEARKQTLNIHSALPVLTQAKVKYYY